MATPILRNNFSNFDNLQLTDTLGLQFSGRTSDPADADLAAGRLYYNSSAGALKIYNGSSWTTLGSGGGGTPSWETIYLNDSVFGITSGTWTITQSSANPIITLNKTNSSSGAVLDITNAGTGADIKNGSAWSILASGGVGVLELGSTGTINATDGALTIGKSGTATTLAGTLTVDGASTLTGAVTATASVTITGTADTNCLVVTAGDVVVSNGKITITNDDTDAIFTATANSVTTGSAFSLTANGVTSGDMVLLTTTDAGFSGSYIRISDGSDVFTIGDEGATTIAGVGASNVLTITAGDMVMSDGSLTMTDADNAATLSITNDTATSASVFVFAGSGTFTGTTTTSFATLTASGLTSGTVLYVPAAALTQGKVIDIQATAATDGILVNVAGGGSNMTATGRMLELAMGAATAGRAIEISTTGVYTGAGVVTIVADSATTSGASVGEGIFAISADGLSTGTALDVTSTSIVLTSGRIADLSHISGNITGTLNKSGDLVSVVSTRTVTTGTVADDFDMGSFVRTSVINGGGSFSAAGSVVYIQNIVTNTSGTVTDTTNGIELLMSANGTGDGINITHSAITGKAINIASSGTTAAGVILVTADALTSGQALKLASSATAITGNGRLFLSSHTGNAGSSAVLNEFASAAADETIVLRVSASAALAAGVLFDVTGAAVTTGTLVDIGDADALTSGIGINLVSNSADTSARTLMQITNDNAAATGAVGLTIKQDSTASSLVITHTGITGRAILVTASQTTQTNGVVDLSLAALTTGKGIRVADADALTSGSIISLVSNSSDTTARNLVFVHNDHASANGAVPLALRNDAATSTNYFKIQTWTNGSNTNTLWMGNGTTANGNLTGTLGDIIINAGSNKPEYCTSNPSGTAWSALV